ncbi:MAG: hypothetical protein Q7R83_03790 [bacterium]|nr:hypothetical protein [bacterium]
MENMTSPAMPAQSGKGGMIAVSVGLLVVGLIGGYFIGKSGTSPVVYQTATPTASSEITGWKTYQNNQFGFTIQYPPGGKVNDSIEQGTTNGDVRINGEWAGNLDFFIDHTANSAQQCRDGIKRSEQTFFTNVDPQIKIINGITFYTNSRGGVAAGTAHAQEYLVTYHNGQCWNFLEDVITSSGDWSLPDKDQKAAFAELNQMMSTFHFTN